MLLNFAQISDLVLKVSLLCHLIIVIIQSLIFGVEL